jgi:glycosyltransferase involved in cell wall biosynthesis
VNDPLDHRPSEPHVSKPDPTPRFSLIVPAYNEVDAIRETVETLARDLAELAVDQHAPPIVVVDDGSTDGTARILEDLKGEFDCLTVITHPRNRGYGAALKTGIARATTPLVGITDADGTYPNARLPELVREAQREQTDMIVGARIAKDEVTYPLIRKIPKVFLVRWASWLARQPIPDINSGMRVFKRESVRRFFPLLPDTFSFTTTITLCMLCNDLRVKYVPIGYSARIGKSKIKPIRDTLRFVQLITRTGMYFAPMRVLTPFFLLFALGGFVSLLVDVFVLGNLTDKTVLLVIAAVNTIMFALLADMIQRRAPMPTA